MGWFGKKAKKGDRKDLKVIEEAGGQILDFIDARMGQIEEDENIDEDKIEGIQKSLAVYIITELLEPFEVPDVKQILKEVNKVYDEGN